MAGDWIPFDHDLPDKTEVVAIATATGASIAETVLRLCRLWCWFDRHTTDGKMKRIGNAGVTLKCGGDDGFWRAVEAVGWIKFGGDDGLDVSIPKFSERFGASARRRLLTAKRVATCKAKRKGNASSVTSSVTEALPNAYPQPQPQPQEQERRGADLIDRGGVWGGTRALVAEAFRGLKMIRGGNAASDRDTMARLGYLAVTGKIPREWLAEAAAAMRERNGKPLRNPVGYLLAIIKEKAREQGLDLKRLLAAVPKPAKGDA